ncbi:MAG: hypothetical protein BWY83_01273 [bacterium ADurb.Bin478]|nr:MAG: hypothetical protein BWY83_01273 [bacterium ADurb.Bin478]
MINRLAKVGIGIGLLAAGLLSAQSVPTMTLPALTVPAWHDRVEQVRTVYNLDCRFSSRDTLLFSRKSRGLNVVAVDSLGPAELACGIAIDSTFADYGVHELLVVDPRGEKKLALQLEIRLSQMPTVDHVTIYQSGQIRRDTLRLASSGRTMASMTVCGNALLSSSTIDFDDAAIKVMNDPSRRVSYSPDSLRFALEVEGRNVDLGSHTFRLQSPFGPDGFGALVFTSEQGPKITGVMPTIHADSRERKVRLNGQNFYKGLRAGLTPDEGNVSVEAITANYLDLAVSLPALDKNQPYRLVVVNADGQADTSNFFIGQAMPLSSGLLFLDRKTRLVIAVDAAGNRRLQRHRSYELNIESNRFPVTQVIDDSTCEVELVLHDKPENTFLDRRTFTLSEAGSAPSWKGMLQVQQPPVITFVSPQRVLHPLDTLNLVIKGSRLAQVDLNLDEAEVVFKVMEKRDDLIRAQAISSRLATPGVYPIEARISGIPFRFEDFSLTVQPWQPLASFARLEVFTHRGDQIHTGWTRTVRPVNTDDGIRVTLMPDSLPAHSGVQKVEIVAVLLDSANIVRSESMDKRYFSLEPGQERTTWQWRPRIRARSGESIELIIRNPGDQNRLMQSFTVKRRWYEAFQPSTSFILFKIPFEGEATTTILSSIGIGMSYQPLWMQKFMSVDFSFILGNVNSGNDDDYSLQTGLGASVIFWNYLQVGLGVDFNGHKSNPTFLFIGSRFKLPSLWK